MPVAVLINPASKANVEVGATDWATPSGAAPSDDAYAPNSGIDGWSTDQLWLKDFDHSALPAGAVVLGIEPELEMSRTATAQLATSTLRLIKQDVLHGSPRSTVPALTGTDTYYAWGGSTDTWDGTFASSDDLKNSSFGFAAAFSTTGTGAIRIDDARINVTWQYGGAPRGATVDVATNQSASGTAATNQSASPAVGTQQAAAPGVGTNQTSSESVGTNQDADVNV